MILAGDIGGTNTRLALFEGSADRLTPGFNGPDDRVSGVVLGLADADHA